MSSRARVVAVSVALLALVTVASVTVGLSSLGVSTGDATDAGVATDTASDTTPMAEEALLDRSTLPERTPDGRSYQSIVIFRNDDIQGNYRPATMRAVDDIFVEEEVPVTLAVIPRIGDRPITDSEGTCSYLVETKRAHPKLFEFSLHGYTHDSATEFYEESEFGGLPAAEQADRIASGKRTLENCTGLTPRTFVPPFNTYDANTTAALRAQDITTVSGGDWFTKQYYGQGEPFTSGGAVHVPSTHSFVGNWTTDEFHTQKEMRRGFDAAYANGSVYVQMLHYPTFNTTEKRERLRSFVRYTKSHDGVKFMTVEEFGRAVRTGTLQRTSDGWYYGNRTSATPSAFAANASVRDVNATAEGIDSSEDDGRRAGA